MSLDLSGKARAIVRALLGAPNPKLSSKTDWRYGTHGSLSVDVNKGQWYDHEAVIGGKLLDLIQNKIGGSKAEAVKWLETQGFIGPKQIHQNRRPPAKSEEVAAYNYRNARGDLQFQVVRLLPKSFRQRRPDGSGGWVWSVKNIAPTLYCLPEVTAAPSDAIIFVAEGEKDCDRLSELGLTATTNPGGAGKWRDSLSSFLTGHRVVIVPDNDDAGRAHARSVAASLQKYGIEVATLELEDLPTKGDVSDWLDNGGTAADLVSRAEAALASAKPAATAEPIPLFRGLGRATEPPIDALEPLLAAVEAIAELTQAPFVLAMNSVLAAASLATQHHADVETLGGDVPLSLALISVAKSGERKSACDTYALGAVREYERACLDEHRGRIGQFNRTVAMLEAERQAALKAKDTEALEVIGSDPPVPLRPNIVVSEPTLEGVLRHFDDGRPSIGIISDEGGQFLGGHAMNRDNALKTAAGLSRLWDGTALERVRASAEPRVYHGRRVAFHLMIQLEIAESVFSNSMLRDQGLLSRTLVVWPESKIGMRLIPVGPAAAEHQARRAEATAALDTFGRRVTELLPLVEASGTDLELTPRRLTLSAEARDLLVDFANAVEIQQAEGGLFEAIQGFASKASQQAARLAGVFTIFDDEYAAEVPGDAMANAINLMTWYLGEAQRVFDRGPIDPLSCDAEKLRTWLVDRFEGSEVDVRTIVRLGPNSLRNASLVHKLTGVLEKNGWLVRVEQRDSGRRTPLWRVIRP